MRFLFHHGRIRIATGVRRRRPFLEALGDFHSEQPEFPASRSCLVGSRSEGISSSNRLELPCSRPITSTRLTITARGCCCVIMAQAVLFVSVQIDAQTELEATGRFFCQSTSKEAFPIIRLPPSPFMLAEMLVSPGPTEVARPPLSIVATCGRIEDH